MVVQPPFIQRSHATLRSDTSLTFEKIKHNVHFGPKPETHPVSLPSQMTVGI
jgi:hypothetical protein